MIGMHPDYGRVVEPEPTCTGCGCEVENSVGLGRECECSRVPGSDVATICVSCCAESAEPCADAIADAAYVRQASRGRSVA